MQQEQQQQNVNALRTVPEMQLLLKMGLIDEKDVLYKGPPLAGPLHSMRQLHCGDVALLKPSTDDLLRRMVDKGQGMLKM
ncbi:hypothetical protein CEP54_013198 [Fusarium duplospermum]|uniref:Uncharacterized protein n=1 Tax=Fusarium duplospermum TaxID=1325734 RepID=A0A428P4C0_9HYPO|nr:hypothetical protein CEP54_013198 [Fusarium duplospermum]